MGLSIHELQQQQPDPPPTRPSPSPVSSSRAAAARGSPGTTLPGEPQVRESTISCVTPQGRPPALRQPVGLGRGPVAQFPWKKPAALSGQAAEGARSRSTWAKQGLPDALGSLWTPPCRAQVERSPTHCRAQRRSRTPGTTQESTPPPENHCPPEERFQAKALGGDLNVRSCDSFTVTLLPPASAKWSHSPQPTGCRPPAPGGVLAPACPQPSLSCTRTGDKNALQTPCPLPSLVQAGSRAQGWPPSPSSRQELTPQPPWADTTQQPETNLDLKTSKYACPETCF